MTVCRDSVTLPIVRPVFEQGDFRFLSFLVDDRKIRRVVDDMNADGQLAAVLGTISIEAYPWCSVDTSPTRAGAR
jgi:hypothetical protein